MSPFEFHVTPEQYTSDVFTSVFVTFILFQCHNLTHIHHLYTIDVTSDTGTYTRFTTCSVVKYELHARFGKNKIKYTYHCVEK